MQCKHTSSEIGGETIFKHLPQQTTRGRVVNGQLEYPILSIAFRMSGYNFDRLK